ncbi:hypothetical protein [Phreatobacter stygius]|uniref:Uncharacterized protein n=1 Tax=Phreatobacter stygius TaxID=1940610 RepID=A0A4D7B7H6_9HYPH|nr:hypothetical protein [Phreatobacter stygius]QCI66350.1 hypothetical protein E8M01_20280 [Phreatobacter stygius]
MSGQHWRMTVYDLGAGATCAVSERSFAFVYAERGGASVTSGGTTRSVETGDGVFAEAGSGIASSGNAWLYEIAPSSLPLRFEAGLSPVLSRIAIVDDGPHILRADRVESQAGAQTPAHRHRGPGIRRLEHGLLRAEVGDQLDRVGAGGAWFETGHETVIGTNISGGTNIFVRVMLLPAELAGGQSSFVAASPADAAKPRAVDLRLFGELPIG